MKKLTDLLNTIYLAEHFAQEVDAILNEHKELDLAGARLTPRISSILLDASRRGVKLRDTESLERDEILLENERRMTLDYETHHLPEYKKEEGIVPFIKQLEEGKVYIPSGDMSLWFPVLTLVQIYSPHIQVDMGHETSGFFKYITETLYRKNLQEVVNSTDRYILFIGDAFQEVTVTEKNPDKDFYLEATGDINWHTLSAMYPIIPSYFGKVKTQKEENLKPIWEPVVKKAMSDIDSHFANRKLKLKEFIKEEA